MVFEKDPNFLPDVQFDVFVESGTEDEQRDAALYRCVGLLKDSRLAAIRFYQLSVELFPLDRYTTFNLFNLQVLVGRYLYCVGDSRIFEILSTGYRYFTIVFWSQF
jgi:hypothetical protein